MKFLSFSKYLFTSFALLGLVTSTANAQCSVVTAALGTLNMSFPSTTTGVIDAQCVFDMGASAGPVITCIRGLPSNLVPSLALVANRAPLSAATRSAFLTSTAIKGGFSYYTVGGQAKTTIFSTQAAFRSYLSNNYNVADHLPDLVTTPVSSAVNAVQSVAVSGTSGILDGFHASGNIGFTPATSFQLIMDAPAIGSTFFYRLGSNQRIWNICTNQPNFLTAELVAVASEYQTGGNPAQKVLLR